MLCNVVAVMRDMSLQEQSAVILLINPTLMDREGAKHVIKLFLDALFVLMQILPSPVMNVLMVMLYLGTNVVIPVLNSRMALENVSHVQMLYLDAHNARLTLNLAPPNVILVTLNQTTIFLEQNAVMLEYSYTRMMKVVILVLILLRVVLHVQ